MRRFSLSLVLALAVIIPTQGEEKLPSGAKIAKIEVWPKSIELGNPFAYAQVLLTARLESGDQVDVTRLAQVERPSFLKVSKERLVRPLDNGQAPLKFTLQGKSVSIPVKVSGQKDQHKISFVRDVMPVISKLGCNAGTCHGSDKGKNGFKLSLRGYDPLFDHRALTDDLEGRRFNRAAPDTSLMLLKTSGAIPHEGGVLTSPGQPYYEMLRSWIADGVKFDPNAARVKSIEVFPKTPVLPLPGMMQQTAVVATFADGAVRDVTAEAFVESSNTEVIDVDKKHGTVTALRRGEAAVMARYQGAYAASTLIVMGDRSGFAWNNAKGFNYVDELVYDKLKSIRVLPSETCDDGDFIRRIYLDLTGLPPTADQVRKFLADKRDSQVKRRELIEKLLGDMEFIEHWTNKWCDLLQVNRKFLGVEGATALRAYVRKAIAENKPYDKFAYDVLTASGSTMENPAAAYYKVLREPDEAMENTTHLFLAIRFNCNKCHDHPFERWTQDQYYEMSAYFARVGLKEDPNYKGKKIGGTAVMGATPLVEIVFEKPNGDVKHVRTGTVAPPKFPFTHGDLPDEKLSRRVQLAQWITSPKNPYFARSYVNRVWSYLMGVGLIEPVDDIRAGNPPSNPQLLDRLTQEFIKSGFDTRQLMRIICQSRAYQHAIQTNKWNEDDEMNYSHALARRLPAEVLFDVIHRATGSTPNLPGLPPGSRAAQLLDSNVNLPGDFLKLFGKPPRESACECERSDSMMLGPILTLVNGPIVGDALKDPNSVINQLAAKEKDDDKLITEIYLRFLSRRPTARELAFCKEALNAAAADHARLTAEHNQRAAALDAYVKDLDVKQAAWEKTVAKPVVWSVLTADAATSKAGAKLNVEKDGSILATGKNVGPEVYTVTATTMEKGITGIRLEVLSDKRLPKNGPGRAPDGNLVLNELKVSAAPLNDPNAKPMPVKLQKPQATFSQAAFPVKNAIDNRPNTGWALAPQQGRSHTAVFETTSPPAFEGGVKLTFELDQRFQSKKHNVGKFRLSVTTSKGPIKLKGLPDAVTKILAVAAEQRNEAQKTQLQNYFRSQDAELKRLQDLVNELGPIASIRQLGAQDIAWALINSKEFLFNH